MVFWSKFLLIIFCPTLYSTMYIYLIKVHNKLHFHYYLNITLEGLSFVKCYAHSSDVYRNCSKMNLFTIIAYLFKKKPEFLVKSVFRSQTIVSVLCFTCKQEMQQDRSYFNLQLSIFESSFYYLSSFNQCKIRLYTCIQFQCICNM